MAKKEKTKKEIAIPAINVKHLKIPVFGSTPLIVHRFSEKIQKGMLDKMEGKAQHKKPPKDPEQEYRDSLYWLDKSGNMTLPKGDPAKHKYGFGFPSRGFKKSMVNACRSIEGVEMTQARNAFHIMKELTPLLNHNLKTFAVPRIRTEPMRLSKISCDIRSRGEFLEWGAILEFEYNGNVITAEQLFNLVNVAGFGVGVGEDRPDKTGGIQGKFGCVNKSK